MSRYDYRPAGMLQFPRLGIRGPGVYDLSPEDAEYVASRLRDEGGELVPVVTTGAEAAADFIAAVSVPTPHNPETLPVADPAPPATPAKRGRKARGV